jgi:hypothetical protein
VTVVPLHQREGDKTLAYARLRLAQIREQIKTLQGQEDTIDKLIRSYEQIKRKG